MNTTNCKRCGIEKPLNQIYGGGNCWSCNQPKVFQKRPALGLTEPTPESTLPRCEATHEKTAMEVDGRDYVTYRLGGKRCRHKIRFICMECGATKSYFENLMGYRGNPTCDGIMQKLSTPSKTQN